MNANPSIDPANYDSLVGTFRHVFNKMLQGVNGMLPCVVIAFDRGPPNRVQVQHLITQITTDGAQVTRGQIASIPVLQLGGGEFVLSFNLKVGDFGWIKANDRDISIFLQSYKESKPQTFRKFNFSDGLFIPDVMTGYEVEESENAVLQSLDGTVKISLGLNEIKIKAPSVIIDSPEVEVTSSTKVVVTTPIFAVDGDITASGNITPHVPPP